MDEVDVAIVGAGFAGLAVACGLAGRRSVRIIERRTAPPAERRALILQPNGLAALQELGALEPVLASGTRARIVRLCDPEGRSRAFYDYGELNHAQPYLLSIEAAALQQALEGQLSSQSDFELLRGCAFDGLLRAGDAVAGIRYVDSSGESRELRTGCVVGADGAGSLVRAAAGIATTTPAAPDPYVIGIGGPAPRVAPGEIAMYCGRGFANGVVPLDGNAYFWDHVTAENREAVKAGDLDGWRAVYRERVPDAAALTAPLTSWEELTVLVPRPFRARARATDGLALLGDAAGTVHPHSAQGANLALEDAVALAAVLREHGGSRPVPGSSLAAYAVPRHRKLGFYVRWSRLAAGSLDAPNPAWRAMRGAGYLWNRVGPVRRTLLRRQAGVG